MCIACRFDVNDIAARRVDEKEKGSTSDEKDEDYKLELFDDEEVVESKGKRKRALEVKLSKLLSNFSIQF